MKVDKLTCRYCKLTEPIVKIRRIKGLPRGECEQCRLALDRQNRVKTNAFKNFFNNLNNLSGQNYRTLASLAAGVYPLVYRTTKAQVGYIALTASRIYVWAFGEGILFRPDFFGVATFVSNQNLVIDPNPMPELRAPDGALVSLSDIGEGLKVERVEDRLLMFDSKLRDWAIGKVKAEIDQLKRKHRRPTAADESKDDT